MRGSDIGEPFSKFAKALESQLQSEKQKTRFKIPNEIKLFENDEFVV